MAAITKTDISVAANGAIRNVAGATNHLPLELHRFLMDLFDDTTGTADDLLDVTNEIIPSVRKTDEVIVLNTPYNIDDALAQRFFGGSIDQLDGNTQYSGVDVGGSTNLGTTELVLIQNNVVLASHWGTGKNPDATKNLILRIVVKSRDAGADIDGKRLRVVAREFNDTFAESSITMGNGNSVAFIETLADDFNTSTPAATAALVGIVNVEGYQLIDLNNGNGAQSYYAKWDKAGNTTKQLYERTKWIEIRGTAETLYGMNGILFRGITHEIVVDGQGVTDFSAVETLTWGAGATAGTARMLAVDDINAATKVWIQLLTGVLPSDNETLTGSTSGATALVNVTVTSRPVSKAFLGTFTGSVSTAFGVGIVPANLTSTDTLRDLLNVAQTPPNNVVFSATNIVAGQIIVATETKIDSNTVVGINAIGATTVLLTNAIALTNPQPGRIVIKNVEHVYTSFAGSTVTLGGSGLQIATAALDVASITSLLTAQYNAITQITGLGTLTIQEVIAQKHPTAGFVRVFNSALGNFDKLQYSSFAGSVFTLVGVTPRAYTVGDDVFVQLMDEVSVGTSLSKTIVYPGTDITGRLRGYDSAANKKPFESAFTIGANGGSVQVNFEADA